MKKKNFKNIAELVDRVKKQDGDAFVELYNSMYQKVYFLALSIVKDEYLAQDVVQETFINVYKNIDALDNALLFMAWLNRICYHCSLKLLEKNEDLSLEGAALEAADAQSEKSGPLEAVLSKERSQTIVNSILELSPEYKTVMILKYYEGLKLDEIAECLECSVGTVKSRLSRGRKLLRKRLSLRGRLSTYLLGGFTLAFSMARYARVNAMPVSFAQRALDNGKTALGISSAAGFFEAAAAAVPLMAVKGSVGGAFALLLISGVVLSSMKPEVSIAYKASPYTNQAVPVSIKIGSILPVKTVQFMEDGADWQPCGFGTDGDYGFQAFKNGRYWVRVSLSNGREEKRSFQITNIDTGLPELHSYDWNEEENILRCRISDDLSGIDYSRIYKLDPEGNREPPVYSHEDKGEAVFSLSAQPFFIYLYDKSGNYAKYRIEPYEIKAG